MKLRSFIYPCIFFALQGCNNSNIDNVKSLVYNYDKSITLGNALDHRSVCNKTNWVEFDDDQGRNVVEYQCELKDIEQYSISQRSTNIKTLENSKSPYKSQLRLAMDNEDHYLSQQEKAKTIDWANDALNKINNNITALNAKPLAIALTQKIRWSIIAGKSPVLIGTTYEVELSDKTQKSFYANSSNQLDSGIMDAYNPKITNYSLFNKNTSGAPVWPFEN